MAWPSGGVVSFSPGELDAAELNVIVDAFNALFPVGYPQYLLRAATTVETLVNGIWLECNGVSVLRATYPALNTALSGLGYPFGTVDGTHMTLPPADGRALVSMASGGHATADAIGDTDGLAKASRSWAPSLTVSVSGTTGAGGAHSHTTGTSSTQTSTGDNNNFNAAANGTYISSTAATHTHTFSGSGSGSAAIPHLVIGTLFIKAF